MKNKDNFDPTIWETMYKMGIPGIDEQHKQFLDFLNEANEILKTNDYESHYYIIRKLENYAKFHFSYEEELMEKANSSCLNDHKIQHESFMKRIEQFKLEYTNQNPLLGQKIVDYIRKWFLSHVLNCDRCFKDDVLNYLKEKES